MLRRARKLIPRTWKGRIAIVAAGALIVAAVFGARHYFGEVPDNEADDYRAGAFPSVRKVTGSMDRVYESFDLYIAQSSVPSDEIREADDLAELKRRILPALADSADALKDGRRAVEAARKRIRVEDKVISATPDGPPLLGDAEPIAETRTASRKAASYMRAAERYLKGFDRFLDYEIKIVELAREGWEESDDLPRDASLEQGRSHFAEELSEAEDQRRRYLELEPVKDTEKLHDLDLQAATATVDFYEDAATAFETLDPALYEDAAADFIAEIKRYRDLARLAYWRFTAKSGIQRQALDLSRQADQLEKRFADLGRGTTDVSELHNRPPVPDKPKLDDRGDGGEDEGSIS